VAQGSTFDEGDTMTTTQLTTDEFQSRVLVGGDRADALRAAAALRAGDAEAPYEVAALALHVAVVAPEVLVDVYDGLTEGWLGAAPDGPVVEPGHPRDQPVSDQLWAGLWDLVFDPDAGRDPALITVRTAALTEYLAPDFHERVAAMALRYPGVAEAAAGGIPPRFTLDALAACPRDSLGGAMHAFVVDNGFDLEVLDRDSLGLHDLPSPLDYCNVRILQCHDIWHLVAGHATSGLHEVSVSGFQMAQFGHQYSSMFLGMLQTKMAFTQPPEITSFTLDTILTGYRHGRESPSLLGIGWEELFALPIPEIRTRLGVVPYDSPYPAWILEEMQGQAPREA
jgi:ubiquinone biosynthesis protein Coq4